MRNLVIDLNDNISISLKLNANNKVLNPFPKGNSLFIFPYNLERVKSRTSEFRVSKQ